MIHARSDYMHIQDDTGKVGKDEPVFLLRAKDTNAPATVRFWANLLHSHGGDKVAYYAALQQADAMDEWAKKNGSKLPDTPRDTVK